jgi:hypothetical protein
MTTLEAALQMGVNPRWAIVTRLAYLGPRISVLEKALESLIARSRHSPAREASTRSCGGESCRVTVKSYAKDCAH